MEPHAAIKSQPGESKGVEITRIAHNKEYTESNREILGENSKDRDNSFSGDVKELYW